eukprot:GHRR01005751.1.p2 GENE.GHRR01005751.1~~GHRR01005751.1.p2  ORF type:complete len:115 (+),score=28.30 GHRR01005751.1:567-911(+)
MVAMSSADVAKTLKIKISTLKRIYKEYAYYQKETDKEQARVESMKAAAADPYDLRQAESVLAESAMMVPETRQRLESALSDLQTFLAENEQDAAGTEELAAAKEAVGSVGGIFN